MTTPPGALPTTSPNRTEGIRTGSFLVLAGVFAVAFNLRTTLTVIGPLIPTIRIDTGASNTALGLIGTIPVLAFGLFSPVAPLIGRRFGTGRALVGSLILLGGATVLRSSGGFAALLVGTALLGVAIAVGNVLLPSLIKGRFPDRVSSLTTAYTAVVVLAATVSAGIAVPLADRVSWEFSAGIWAIPAMIGAVIVTVSVLLEGRTNGGRRATTQGGGMSTRQMYRSALAWQITAFTGLQSAVFYVYLAWLPDILIAKGMTDAAAGAMVSVLNVAGLVGVLVIPLFHRGRGDQRRSMAIAGGCCVLGSAALLVPGTTLAPVASALLGLGLGATLALALTFFALRTTTAADAASLSGMAQTWGYLVSAFGPVLWGVLRDGTGSWTFPLVLLVAMAAATTVAGLAASRDHVVTLSPVLDDSIQ